MKTIVPMLGFGFVVSVSQVATGATWYVDGSVPESGNGASWETALKTIQEGVDEASDGDTVIVAEGTYFENIDFSSKNITLRGSDPSDSTTVANTIIDGNQAGSVVTFSGAEGTTCLLSGFTIRNGSAEQGGGIRGRSTRACITHNVITANLAQDDGGGLHRCDGTIENNTICGNATGDDGGGLHNCDGTIKNNTVSGNTAGDDAGGFHTCDGVIESNIICRNSADHSGGGFSRCDARIQNNKITENWAGFAGGFDDCNGIIKANIVTRNWASDAGGGLRGCSGIIEGNQITENTADTGGGLYSCTAAICNNTIAGNWAYYCGGGLAWCHGPIQNNLIVENRSGSHGGGLMSCGGTIQNNTIVGNSADAKGGGLHGCTGIIVNCIVWGNSAVDHTELSDSSVPTYSCIQDWTGGGEGNIAENPRFLDPDGPDDRPETYSDNDYRLLPDSPCIDAGDNDAPALPETDIEGNPRIMYGGKGLIVDMGAYECYINKIEVKGQTEVTLTWSSVPGKRYSVYCSGDMTKWELAADNILSMGDTVTTWVDATASILSPDVTRRYYKVTEHE